MFSEIYQSVGKKYNTNVLIKIVLVIMRTQRNILNSVWDAERRE